MNKRGKMKAGTEETPNTILYSFFIPHCPWRLFIPSTNPILQKVTTYNIHCTNLNLISHQSFKFRKKENLFEIKLNT